MIEAPLPHNEAERLAALREYAVLDTDPEEAFDDLTRLAAQLCSVPIAVVSLVDSCRQWFKSRVGLSACETPRGVAFCAHAILRPQEILVIEDTLQDPRFAYNPLVESEPRIRFYAGAPIVTPDGIPLGTLCVIDREPRRLEPGQLESLRTLANQVMTQLELRKKCAELRKLAADLEHTNRELKDFTHVAAHDLQEPVRKLISFSELLKKDLGEQLPQRAEDDLGFIVDASLRMRQLITDLLEFSRAGASELRRSRIVLKDLVSSVLETFSLRLGESGAEVEVDELPVVWGDPTLLGQLFQNLVGNALKFVGSERPRIHVTCRRDDGELVLGVEDNGIGIDPRYVEQIFTPFKRLHGRAEYAGTGIGLAISRKAVERHGGRIWVESEPGRGAHFRFALPATCFEDGIDGCEIARLEPSTVGQ